MILPTKRLSADRSLLAIDGTIIGLLDQPKTVSRLWEEFKYIRKSKASQGAVTYDWFILALDFLYTLDAIAIEDGLLVKSNQ